MKIFLNILAALIATELVECIVALIWQNDKKTILAVLLCNLITNPAVNGIMQVIYHFYPDQAIVYYSVLSGLEIVTILVEGAVLDRMLPVGRKKAYLMSLAFNCCSFFAGLAITIFG